jgi:hypothetical protein
MPRPAIPQASSYLWPGSIDPLREAIMALKVILKINSLEFMKIATAHFLCNQIDLFLWSLHKKAASSGSSNKTKYYKH